MGLFGNMSIGDVIKSDEFASAVGLVGDAVTGNYIGAAANAGSLYGSASGNSYIKEASDTAAGYTSTTKGFVNAGQSVYDAADGAEVDTEQASKLAAEFSRAEEAGASQPLKTSADASMEDLYLSDLAGDNTVEGGLGGTGEPVRGEYMNQDFGDSFMAGVQSTDRPMSAMYGLDTISAIDSMKQGELASAFGQGTQGGVGYPGMSSGKHWASQGASGIDLGATAAMASDPNQQMANKAMLAKTRSMSGDELKEFALGDSGGSSGGGGSGAGMSAAAGIVGMAAQAYADKQQQDQAQLEQAHNQGMARQAQLRSMQSNYQPGMTIADLIQQGGMA